ncbi:ABC transporter permease [Shewanella baltica]|uniref:Binding-protein-dependent transport systems inner membrane component n=1 Tax=Shewanella baltica (strain OS195) TaxID=399599 RepID=A9KWI7_SHEB9|nr:MULTISPECIES: ABC transporter permease [Shewanella]ABS07750.1 binding-protein-dependent transport systems inner membrane component [Shewanella baltica OS185]ABX48810.1 binding-protein-dependent transport systems inner membrane component [Shewanella baltica OS195]ACK47228.1 binding-protein-dependent transport systems inner membrane component [Shewanella baltica OS223]ADT93849.1 binding-protein-dependent transport systems inner membrane component [Shewanella baltica OS678]AVT50066.1 ABC trans
MFKYLLRRLNLFLATSLVMVGVLFYATGLFPVDRTHALTGIHTPTASQLVQIEQDYKLDKNQAWQFIAYLQQRLSGNLGISVTSHQEVAEELSAVLPASFELAVMAAIIAICFGVPLGVLASQSQHKLTQNTIMAITLTGYSVPVFWLGLYLSLWFGVDLGWLPISGQINLLYEIKPVTGFMLVDTLLSESEYGMSAFKDALLHIILPATTLAVLPFTVVVRSTRSAMMNVMNQTFIRAAEARGMHTGTIILRHALPNALIPVLKHLGLMLGSFASYAIVVEMIFSWPGVGSWLVSGIYQRDYTVIQGGILAVALLIIFLSILIEVLHTVFNPLSRKDLYATS